jgi:hypothetical protein
MRQSTRECPNRGSRGLGPLRGWAGRPAQAGGIVGAVSRRGRHRTCATGVGCSPASRRHASPASSVSRSAARPEFFFPPARGSDAQGSIRPPGPTDPADEVGRNSSTWIVVSGGGGDGGGRGTGVGSGPGGIGRGGGMGAGCGACIGDTIILRRPQHQMAGFPSGAVSTGVTEGSGGLSTLPELAGRTCPR